MEEVASDLGAVSNRPFSPRDKVRVAHALAGLDRISAAFKCGSLSYSKVRAITRVATVENEAYLLEVAQQCTATQVERLVRSYRGVINQHDECHRVKKQFGRRYVSYYTEEDGSIVITARLPAEEGAWVITIEP